ncbi:putative B3 domain-containing protein At3g24850 [Argentina anserina]|uniref:putative B3 domain-containing protein At3g24850 n=1 Tax=Argentina anserina TaxID=57926 RepID=UPI0021764182|nr:putative B3 domain-containing protein At3g24850 [Potentilla anserina]
MGHLTVEAMQVIKSKVYGDNKKMPNLDQLALVAAVASNKEEEIIFENSSSAQEALRKLNALKIFSPSRDDADGHSDRRVEFTKLKKDTLDSKIEIVNCATGRDDERGYNSMPTCDRKKVRASDSKKPEQTSKKMKYSQPLATQLRDLPEEFKRKIETMGGCSDEARLVIEKPLIISDCRNNASRLTMPENQLLWPFLEKDEAEWLDKSRGELHITLIDPMVEEEKICLAQWNYPSSISYILRTGWNYVVAKNALKAMDLIQVWSFRNKTNSRLHLALVKRGVDSRDAGCSSSSTSYASSTVVDGEIK